MMALDVPPGGRGSSLTGKKKIEIVNYTSSCYKKAQRSMNVPSFFVFLLLLPDKAHLPRDGHPARLRGEGVLPPEGRGRLAPVERRRPGGQGGQEAVPERGRGLPPVGL